MVNVGVMGTGYVGLVHGAVLSSYGFRVTCMDVDEHKIERLNQGFSPIYEPGLEELLQSGIRKGTLTFTTNAQQVVQSSDVLFIAVGTPAKEDGSADLTYVWEVVQQIGKYINGNKVIVSKSTMPVGTSRNIEGYLGNMLKGTPYQAHVASNPEFLRQGKAVSDSLSPSRVVIGADSEEAVQMLKTVYATHLEQDVPFLFTNLETSEMIKYASNSFLAVKISFINELALLSEKVGARIQDIATGMGMDDRISPHFLQAGPGYGGSCFPKDTQAIVDVGRKNGEELYVVRAAIAANEKQKSKMVSKIEEAISFDGTLKGKTIAIWGLTFKPDTDDIRYAPSYDIIQGLLGKGAAVKVYCPQGMKQAARDWPELSGRIQYCGNEAECAQQADAIVLMTEWEQFRGVSWERMARSMRRNVFFDMRNMFAGDIAIRNWFQYYPVGSMEHGYSLREAQ
ncbi:UDP-glucose dehydrogenase family protein [Paenibacillus glycanilyticus]|uniref:UDP-glucose 6-dehydrogenase n=1 Tax=Paenibacillus glycanilyticus TaxID=126569 RepID=A0ABQ6GEP6_9BACL|nr:UDP-glucose/GDP-mannose dehydrogenase family protein [Paenibacillus glycanilyticus]GLX68708.1 UDP-glucose 6-dehydrogenase [Paenibacillus glycanilyticus]